MSDFNEAYFWRGIAYLVAFKGNAYRNVILKSRKHAESKLTKQKVTSIHSTRAIYCI